MSSDFPALVNNNELALNEPERRRIVKLFQEKAVTSLSPEREMGPFLLYAVGDSLDTIALKTNLPKDVILATAIQYRWPEKAKMLRRDTLNPDFLQKELANTLLVATYKALMDDLGAVIAGKKSAKEVGLIPKNMAALQNLMDLVSKLNAPAAEPNAPAAQTHIHATNVQINQQLPAAEKADDVPDVKRLEMLKAIDS